MKFGKKLFQFLIFGFLLFGASSSMQAMEVGSVLEEGIEGSIADAGLEGADALEAVDALDSVIEEQFGSSIEDLSQLSEADQEAVLKQLQEGGKLDGILKDFKTEGDLGQFNKDLEGVINKDAVSSISKSIEDRGLPNQMTGAQKDVLGNMGISDEALGKVETVGADVQDGAGVIQEVKLSEGSFGDLTRNQSLEADDLEEAGTKVVNKENEITELEAEDPPDKGKISNAKEELESLQGELKTAQGDYTTAQEATATEATDSVNEATGATASATEDAESSLAGDSSEKDAGDIEEKSGEGVETKADEEANKSQNARDK